MTRKVLAVVCVAVLSLSFISNVVQADDNHWSIDSNGVITDSRSRLQWYVGPNNVTWEQSVSYCTNLSVAGGGWRMPSLDELRGLYTGHGNWLSHHSLPPTFKAKELNVYTIWSNETEDSSSAWRYHTFLGDVDYYSRDYSNRLDRVFAVRFQR